jgi:chromosome segregation ATPase
MSDLDLTPEAVERLAATLAKPKCIRVCTTTGGPSHDGEKWVHQLDYSELRAQSAAAAATLRALRARLTELEDAFQDMSLTAMGAAIEAMENRFRAEAAEARLAEVEAALATARADALREAAAVADYAGAIQDQRDGSYAGSVAVMGRDVGDLIRALAQEQTNDR